VFPNAVDPQDAPYNRHQFAALNRHCHAEVLALVPWFPLAPLAGDRLAAGRLARLPARWQVDGLEVYHPRVLYVPRVPGLSRLTYTLSLLPAAMRRRGRVDVVLGAFGYPDAWAAVAIARLLGVPAVVKVHGSDVNVFGEQRIAEHLRWSFERAYAVVAPSRQLTARAVELGADPQTSRHIPNGVDLDCFRPRDRDQARDALGHPRQDKTILFVGRLEPEKGTDDLLDALELMAVQHPGLRLVLIGEGDRGMAYRADARARGLRATFVGAQPHARVADWIAACDVLALPSWAEGTPNVVLEALASGRPVVASAVGGIPDVVHHPDLGELVPPRSAIALAAALERVLSREHDAQAIAAAAGLGDWAESGRRLYEVAAEASRAHRATGRSVAAGVNATVRRPM
jgi:glycosyltransferase involved in cell wall biosynthesis